MTSRQDGEWAALADDLPAAPRSHLQPLIEAWARGDDPPAVTGAPGTLDPEPEMWLLGRATSAGCKMALILRTDLDVASLAAAVLDVHGGLDDSAAAVVEDILKALAEPAEDGTIDPTRIVRANSNDVLIGFTHSILGLAHLISEASRSQPDEVVRLCFSAADGTFQGSQ